MGLFDLFRSLSPHPHPAFGPLQYARGRWRGTIALDGQKLALFVPGSRDGPAPDAVQIAERASTWWAAARPQLEAAIFEHYEGGRDAGIEGVPALSAPVEVWPHVTLSSLQVRPYGARDEVEVALRVVWDEEHTLGALVRDGEFAGLNGSILEPR